MKGLFRLTTVCVAAILCAGLSRGDVLTTYFFSGDCADDCTGQGQGILVLQNYTPGDNLDISNFVSFSYKSSVLDIEADSLGSIFGALPVNLPGPAEVSLQELVASVDCVGCSIDFESHTFDNNHWGIGVDDDGPNGIWSGSTNAAVPEPASVSLILGVLMCLAVIARRRMHRAPTGC